MYICKYIQLYRLYIHIGNPNIIYPDLYQEIYMIIFFLLKYI